MTGETRKSVDEWRARTKGRSVGYLGMFSRFVGNYDYCPDRFAASRYRLPWLQAYPRLRTGWNRVTNVEVLGVPDGIRVSG